MYKAMLSILSFRSFHSCGSMIGLYHLIFLIFTCTTTQASIQTAQGYERMTNDVFSAYREYGFWRDRDIPNYYITRRLPFPYRNLNPMIISQLKEPYAGIRYTMTVQHRLLGINWEACWPAFVFGFSMGAVFFTLAFSLLIIFYRHVINRSGGVNLKDEIA